MKREYVENILPNLSPEDREQTPKAIKHSCSLYDELGNHVPHDYEIENLLNVLSQHECFVIDNCFNWRKEYPKSEIREKAFIISPALAREYSNTKYLMLSTDRYQYGNLFSIGILPIQDGRYRIMVDRIDEHFRYVFDLPALSKASKGKGEAAEQRTVVAHSASYGLIDRQIFQAPAGATERWFKLRTNLSPHPGRENSLLNLVPRLSPWATFRRHSVALWTKPKPKPYRFI